MELQVFAGSDNHLRGLFADNDIKRQRFGSFGIHQTYIIEKDLSFY